MPRFHFNVYDGVTLLDNHGTDLDSWEEARLEAIVLTGHLLKDHPKRIALGEEWRMEVTDENGLVLFRLDFTVLESPAMLGTSRNKLESS